MVAFGERPTGATVVVVDDHELMREGIRSALEDGGYATVVGEAADRSNAISLIESLEPDVVLVDIRLREGSGVDVVRACKEIAPRTRILIFSAYDDDQYVKSMVRLGVWGYLMKSASGEDLRRAVRDVAEGNLVFPRGVAGKVLRVLEGDGRGRATKAPERSPHRERVRGPGAHRRRTDKPGDRKEIGNLHEDRGVTRPPGAFEAAGHEPDAGRGQHDVGQPGVLTRIKSH